MDLIYSKQKTKFLKDLFWLWSHRYEIRLSWDGTGQSRIGTGHSSFKNDRYWFEIPENGTGHSRIGTDRPKIGTGRLESGTSPLQSEAFTNWNWPLSIWNRSSSIWNCPFSNWVWLFPNPDWSFSNWDWSRLTRDRSFSIWDWSSSIWDCLFPNRGWLFSNWNWPCLNQGRPVSICNWSVTISDWLSLIRLVVLEPGVPGPVDHETNSTLTEIFRFVWYINSSQQTTKPIWTNFYGLSFSSIYQFGFYFSTKYLSIQFKMLPTMQRQHSLKKYLKAKQLFIKWPH